MSDEQPLRGTPSPLVPSVSNEGSGVEGQFYGPYAPPASPYDYLPTVSGQPDLQTSQFFPFFGFPFGGFGFPFFRPYPFFRPFPFRPYYW